jgi:hypothetical protein
MKLVIELPVSEAEEPIQWIERLQTEIERICEENDIDPLSFIRESSE